MSGNIRSNIPVAQSVATKKQAAPGTFIRSLRQEGPNSILIECDFEQPSFERAGQGKKFRQNIPAQEAAFELPGQYLFGFWKTLNIPPGARIEVLNGPENWMRLTGLDEKPLQDMPLTKDRLQASAVPSAPVANLPRAEIKYLGKMRSAHVSSVNFYPYRYDRKAGKLLYTRKISVRISADQPLTLAQVSTPPAAVFERREFSAGKTRNSLLAAVVPKAIPTAPDGFQYKIIVDREGIVRVYARQLRDAKVPVDALNSRTLKLWNKGVEIPLYVFDRNNEKLESSEFAEEYIEFHAVPNRKNFSNADRDIYNDTESPDNVYVLTWGEGLGKRIVEESGDIRVSDPERAIDLRGQSFTSRVLVEENNVSVNFSGSRASGYPAKDVNMPAGMSDNLYWARVGVNESVRIPVALPFPDLNSTQPISLRVMLRGATNLQKSISCQIPEHNAEVDINNHRALGGSWAGHNAKLLDDARNLIVSSIPANAAIQAEQSVVTVRNVFNCQQQKPPYPSFLVNWLELSYRRQYKAYQNNIEFSIPDRGEAGLYTFTVENFSQQNIIIYRKGISRIINAGLREVKQDSTGLVRSYTANFQAYAASPDEKFLAITENLVLSPKAILRDRPSTLSNPANDADYMAITDTSVVNKFSGDTSDVKHPLQRLKSLHSQQLGLKVAVIDVQDIFDEFNYGIYSREAVRDFLRYAYRNWTVAPRYAVLWGDARQIPPDYWQTVDWGLTPTDYTYGFIEGSFRNYRDSIIDDVFPELIVSRIPVQSKDQAAAVVDKIEQYLKTPDLNAYRSSAIMIAGTLPLFETQNEDVIELIPRSVSVNRIYVGNSAGKYYGSTSRLISEMDKGAAYINYIGHGGGAVWDDAGLMEPAQVKEINNRGKYFVVSSPTCFTGAYESQQGLLTAFILEPERGAIAAWGNSGYGWVYGSANFAKELGRTFFSLENNNRAKSIGQLFVDGKVGYLSKYGSYVASDEVELTMVLQCTMMGDPALPFGVAKKKADLELSSYSASAGDQIGATLRTPFSQGQAVVELFDSRFNGIEGTRQLVTINSQNTAFSVQVPAGYSEGSFGVRSYANDYTMQNEVEADATVSTGGIVISELTTVPAPVVRGQDLNFRARVISRNPVSSVECKVSAISQSGSIFTTSLPCVQDGPNYYRTSTPLPASYTNSGRIEYSFLATAADGTQLSSETKTVYLDGSAELAAFAMSPVDSANRFGVGTEARNVNSELKIYQTAQGAQLGAWVYNWGESDAENAEAELRYIDRNGVSQSIVKRSALSIPAKSRIFISAPAPLAGFEKTRVILDVRPDPSGVNDFAGNNSSENRVVLSSFQFDPAIGTTKDGVAATPVGSDGIAFFEAPANPAIAQKFIFSMTLNAEAVTVQPGIRFIRLQSGAYSASISPVDETSVQSGQISLWYDTADSNLQGRTPAIYRQNARTGLWTRLSSNIVAAGRIQAQAELPGTYAVGVSNDATAPNIALSVEGQFFSNRGAVPPNPKITFVASDENGVQTGRETILIELDGKQVQPGEYSVIDSTVTPTSTSILYRPSLSQGLHTICATVLDQNGNASNKTCAQMNVSTELGLDVLGTFPNPFRETVFLAYEIKGVNSVDEVEIKFFTASGRAIRRLVYPSANSRESFGLLQGGTGIPTSLGYHEAWWNGTDEVENQVANGVYFYRIRVKSGDKVVEQQGKLARVR